MSKLSDSMLRAFPNAPIVKVKMLYEKEVKKYCEEIEKAHKRAGKSKLFFGPGK